MSAPGQVPHGLRRWASRPIRDIITILLVLLTCVVGSVLLARANSAWVREATLGSHGGEGTVVALSEDGTTGASAGPDGRVIVWDLATRAADGRFEGPPKEPTAVCLSPDGRLLAVGYHDASVRVWPVAGGGEVVTLGPESEGATGLAISHDGDRVAVCGEEARVTVWGTADGRLMSTAERHAPDARSGCLFFTKGDWAIGCIPVYDGGSGSPWFVKTTTGEALSALGSTHFGGRKRFAFAGRLSDYQSPEFDLVLSDEEGREETFRRTILVPTGIRRYIPQWGWDAGTRMVDEPPEHVNAVAFGVAGRQVLVASPNGLVVLARAARAGDWRRGWLPWIGLALGLALIGWLVVVVRMRRRERRAAADAGPEMAPARDRAERRLPLSLRILAYLAIIWGVVVLGQTVLLLFRDQVHLDLMILNIFAGIGLLRLRRGWRVFVLVEVWIAFVAVGALAGALLAESPLLTWTFLGVTYGQVPAGVGWLVAVGVLVVSAWAYWVLTRPKTQALFLGA